MDSFDKHKNITSKELHIDDLEKPLVLSYDNNMNENSYFYMNTLDKNNWEYIIVGQGDKWENFMTRVNSYLTFLKTLPSEKIVILTDCRDVACCRPPKAFIKAFQSFGKKMIVSMELFCEGYMDRPDNFIGEWQCVALTPYWNYHEIKNLPHRKYVNNGLICGKVIDLIHNLEWAINNNYKDDQFALGNYVNTFPERVVLDVEAKILHTSTFGFLAGLDDINIQNQDSPTFAEFFGRGAFFLHIPGLTNVKGQHSVYEFVQKIINAGINDSIMTLRYNHASSPDWK